MFEKGCINGEGSLLISRKSDDDIVMRQQYCPYDQEESPCAGWCPLFGSVKERIGRDLEKYYELDLCRKIITFKEFDYKEREEN